MNQTLIIILVIGTVISLIGSAFIIAYVMVRNKERENNLPADAVHRARPGKEPFTWKRIFPVLFWIFYYLCIGIIILIQCLQGMEGREFIQLPALIVPSVFFIIGYTYLNGINKRRRLATASAVATVISIKRVSTDSSPYAPVYEFYVNGLAYKVISPATYSTCPVLVGESVELKYAPEQPRTIFVPEYEKRTPPVVTLCLFIGIVFPLAFLIVPLAG